MNMTKENYILQRMQAVELRLNVIVAKNAHLINSLNGYINDHLNRKYSHIPYKSY